MGLPRDALIFAVRNDTEPSPNSRLSPNQTPTKGEDARIAQRNQQRRRRNAVGVVPIARATCRASRPARTQSAPPRPSSRRSRRCADHRRELAGMRQQIAPARRRPPSPRRTARKRGAPNRRATGLAKASSQTALNPRCVQIGVQQRVGEEAPDLRARAAGQNAVGERACVIARRHESKRPHQHAVASSDSSIRARHARAPSTASITTTTAGTLRIGSRALVQGLAPRSALDGPA